MHAILQQVIQLNSTVRSYQFTTASRLRHEPGQFIELSVKMPDGSLEGRWFTVSSAPSEDHVSITTRHTATDSQFKKQLSKMQAGDMAYISDAMGDFMLPIDSTRPVTFTAIGIGITPFRSMAYDAQLQRKTYDIQLIYGARNQDDILFRDLWDTLPAGNRHFVHPQSAVHTFDWAELVSADLILQYAQPDSLIYLAGPEAVVEELDKNLRSAGVARDRLVTDYFAGYATE